VVGATLAAVLIAAAAGAGVLSSGCSTPTGQTPAPARHGFAIVGHEGRFATLGEAVRTADGGDTIEVSGDGPIASPRIDVRGKRLTVRAAAGCRPVFVPGAAARSAQWLTSDTDLTLEGIGVDWPGGEPADAASMSRDEAAVSARGRLALRRCRVVSSGRMGCVACDGALTVESCHLVADEAGGGCVIWKPSGPLAIDRTALEGRSGVLIGLGVAGRSPAAVTDCTFRTDAALVYVLPRPPAGAVPTTVRRGVLDAAHVVTVFYGPSYPGPPKPTAAETKAAVRKVAAYRLPAAYVELLKVCNGGSLRLSVFPTTKCPRWAEDHVAFEQVMGICKDEGINSELGSAYLIAEWEYPDVGVVISSDGHTAFMLDYSKCGPEGNPGSSGWTPRPGRANPTWWSWPRTSGRSWGSSGSHPRTSSADP
jgi:hypothetical protein